MTTPPTQHFPLPDIQYVQEIEVTSFCKRKMRVGRFWLHTRVWNAAEGKKPQKHSSCCSPKIQRPRPEYPGNCCFLLFFSLFSWSLWSEIGTGRVRIKPQIGQGTTNETARPHTQCIIALNGHRVGHGLLPTPPRHSIRSQRLKQTLHLRQAHRFRAIRAREFKVKQGTSVIKSFPWKKGEFFPVNSPFFHTVFDSVCVSGSFLFLSRKFPEKRGLWRMTF